MIQGSPEWHLARCGHITASRFCDVMAKVKVGEAATRRDYRWELVTERLSGVPCEGYTNRAMEWGTAHEAEARLAYEAATGNLVDVVGFIPHPRIAMVGGSPDGLIDDDGGQEIKCPYNSVVHVQTLAGGMPPEHRAQVQGNMWVSGRQWWDFVSFDPRMPKKLRLYVQRILRDDAYITLLEAEVIRFNGEVSAQLESLLKAAA